MQYDFAPSQGLTFELSNLDAHKKPHEPKGHAFQRPNTVPVETATLSWKQVLAANASLRLFGSIYTRAFIRCILIILLRELPALPSM